MTLLYKIVIGASYPNRAECFLNKVNELTLISENFLQGEMQQLRDKLAITERAAKSEAQLKVIILSNRGGILTCF